MSLSGSVPSRCGTLCSINSSSSSSVTSRELGQLPPPVLQLLSTEAQQGLLHLQALRLLPPQLEVTHALTGAPGSECCSTACQPVYSAATVAPVQPARRHTVFRRWHGAFKAYALLVCAALLPPPCWVAAPVQMCAVALHRLQVVAQHSSPSRGPHRTRHSHAVERGSATRNGDSTLQQTAASREAAAGCQALGQVVSGGVVGLQLLICGGQLLLQDSDATVAVLQRAVEQGTWASAGALLGQLEALCRAHSVPCAAVDGGMLLRLAAACCGNTNGPLPALADLLACVSNLGDVAPYLLPPAG